MCNIENKSESVERNLVNAIGMALIVLFVIVGTSSISYGQTFVTKWGADLTSDGHFDWPAGVAVDPSGNVYVADQGNRRIQKFTSSGSFVMKWPSEAARGIALDSSGNIYVTVTVTGATKIKKFDPSGYFLTEWGSYGTGNGQFRYPEGIAVDSSGNVYVADHLNHRIQKFDGEGNFLGTWGTLGSADGEFNRPTGVAVDSSGNVYVADAYNSRIQKFTSSGTFLAKWGTIGSGNSQFRYPWGVAIDSAGNVYVTEGTNNRVQKFTSSGTFIDKWGSYGHEDGQFYSPVGIAVDSSGSIYVADLGNYRIQKFNSDTTFDRQWGSDLYANGNFNEPRDLATDSLGNIYVVDSTNSRVQKFTSSGSFLNKWGSYGSGNSQFDYPTGIAIGPSGSIYIADAWNSRIQKFDSSGAFLAKWGTCGSGNGQFLDPFGVAVDSSENVYVADSYNSRIQKFDSSGAFLAKWGTGGSGDGQFNWPIGIAVDSSGNVYVVDTNNNRVQKFTSSGTFIVKWGSYGSGDGQFRLPVGITTDASGYIYVSDSYNQRVQKFAPFITINASAGVGGIISPSGDVAVSGGANQTFTFTADKWFTVQDVLVDGVSQGSIPSYTFTSVNANHTISVSFALDTNPPNPVGSGTASTNWPIITMTFTYTGPTTYLVPPDCNNVLFISDPPIPQICRRIPPYILSVLEDAATPGYGSPGGDWIKANPGDSWTISCNMMEVFDVAALQIAGNVKIIPMYTSFGTDRGLGPWPNCPQGTNCCAPGDICVDTSLYILFQGTMVANQTSNAQDVQIDIKPGTYPNTINLGSHGVVPVAILSSATFDARTVKPESVTLAGAHVKLTGKGTPIFSYADVNGDGKPDLIVNVLTDALDLSLGDTEAVLVGVTTTGAYITGKDTVRVVPAN